MKYLLTIIFTLTILTAQEGEVTNVVAEQRTDGSHIVDISYDLLPDSQFPSFTVFAYISIDAGETFESFDINNNLFPNVLGDNVLPGIGKSFYWDHIQDYDEISSDNIIFKISAYGHIAISVDDVYLTCDRIKASGGNVVREAGPMKGTTVVMAFVEDPDGYKIELLGEEVFSAR